MTTKEFKLKAGPKAPDWLKLEPDEQYLKSYPAKQGAILVCYLALIALGICGAVFVFMKLTGCCGNKDMGWLVSILGTSGAMIAPLAQLYKCQLHVTSKMLVFGDPPKKIQGLPLEQVTRLERGTGFARWTISIFGPRGSRPVTKATVLNTDEVLAELSELCQQARGAGLRNTDG